MEQFRTNWDELQPPRKNWNEIKLAKNRSRIDCGCQLQWLLLVAAIHQTENLNQTDNNTNTENFYGNFDETGQVVD